MFGARKNIFDKLIESNRNIIISGDISSGKTSNIIFPILDRIMYNDENYLFLDSKEEYINKYYGYLKNKDYNIIIINLQEPDRSNGLNIFDYPYSLYNNGEYDKSIEYLENIAQNIFFEKNTIDPFWNYSSCNLFVGLSLILFENATKEEINFSSINNLVDNPKLKEFVISKDKNSKIYNSLSGIVLAPNETKNGIVSTFKQQIRKIISKEKINNILSKTNIDLNKITNEKTAIFIIARDDNKDINITASVIIEQIFKIVFDNNSHRQFNLILDNIDVINNIYNLSNMLSSGIARDIKTIIGTRSLEDFNKKYSEYIEKLSNIISINSRNIEVVIDNKYEKIRYSLSPYNFPKDTINYPIITSTNTKVFTLDNKFLSQKKSKNNLKGEKNSINPFLNKEDNNIFSVYQDNRINNNNKNDNKIEDLVNRIDKKIKELSNEDKNLSKEKNNDKIQEINNKVPREKHKNKSTIDENITTNELLKMIDKRIFELEESEKNKAGIKKTENSLSNSSIINSDVFPNIEDNNKSASNIITETSGQHNKKIKQKVKNTLAHYKDSEKIEKQIEEELEKLGFIKYIDEKKYYMNGYKNKKQQLLKEKYNLENDKNSIF
ncbi:MAG: type IV secretion system DNA-binding domain-containing protein [Bacilli bacterium]|nr:type IV secretion system DNA-binding domain-containing protein [Bacilli bacterium]